jgi:hypothetical protein
MSTSFQISVRTIQKTALLLFAATVPYAVPAQTVPAAGQRNVADEVRVYFPVNKTTIEINYQGNNRELARLKKILGDAGVAARVDSIVVNAYSSPEGGSLNNSRLAAERAGAVKAYIVQNFPKVNSAKIVVRSHVSDWKDIKNLLENDRSVPNRDEALRILSSNLADAQMSAQLKALGGGATLRYITAHYAKSLRYATGVVFHLEGGTKVEHQTDTVYVQKVVEKVVEKVNTIEVCRDEWVKKPLFAVKTNLLFDMATVLNAEIEIPMGKRWSTAWEYHFPWWLLKNKQYAIESLGGNLEIRLWLGNRENRPQLTGWFLGVHGGGGYYDFEWDRKWGYQGEYWMAGLVAGYAHTINKSGSLRFEYELGAGYLQSRYRKYEPKFGLDSEWHLIRQHSGVEKWIGPTRAKISLVWMLNHGKYRKNTKTSF